ncbi:MAG: hypothetical protein MI824_26380, partial [Hyphomicrobiales bacterium]|nr:hypothetical protein [Hyphomicrobiales bacterium]
MSICMAGAALVSCLQCCDQTAFRVVCWPSIVVMPGRDPGIHSTGLSANSRGNGMIAGSSPAMKTVRYGLRSNPGQHC